MTTPPPSLALRILAPDAVVLDARVAQVQAADATGRFGLRPGHEAFVTVLAPALLVYTDLTGVERYAAVDGGVLTVEGDRVSVVTREAVLGDRLEELAATAAAILEGRRRQERQAQTEFEELQTVLAKQLARMGRPT